MTQHRTPALHSKYDGNYHVRNGFLVESSSTSDAAGRPEEDPDDTIEIHNYLPDPNHQMAGEEPADDRRRRRTDRLHDEEPEEEQQEQGEEVGRFSEAEHEVVLDGGDYVVRRGSGSSGPDMKSDRHDMPSDSRAPTHRSRDSRSRPPQTLAELNAFNSKYYRRMGGRR